MSLEHSGPVQRYCSTLVSPQLELRALPCFPVIVLDLGSTSELDVPFGGRYEDGRDAGKTWREEQSACEYDQMHRMTSSEMPISALLCKSLAVTISILTKEPRTSDFSYTSHSIVAGKTVML